MSTSRHESPAVVITMKCCAGVTCCVASSDLMVFSTTGNSGVACWHAPKASTSPASLDNITAHVCLLSQHLAMACAKLDARDGCNSISHRDLCTFVSIRGAEVGLHIAWVHRDSTPTMRLGANNTTQYQQCDSVPTMRLSTNSATQYQQCDSVPTTRLGANNALQYQQCDSVPTMP